MWARVSHAHAPRTSLMHGVRGWGREGSVELWAAGRDPLVRVTHTSQQGRWRRRGQREKERKKTSAVCREKLRVTTRVLLEVKACGYNMAKGGWGWTLLHRWETFWSLRLRKAIWGGGSGGGNIIPLFHLRSILTRKKIQKQEKTCT